MMAENKLHLIPLDIYMRDVAIIISSWGDAIKAISDQMKKGERKELMRSEPLPSERGRYFTLISGLSVIWIRKGLSPTATNSTLIHEIVHASIGILKSIGVSLCSKSEEAYAYLIEYLVLEAQSKLGISHAFDRSP